MFLKAKVHVQVSLEILFIFLALGFYRFISVFLFGFCFWDLENRLLDFWLHSCCEDRFIRNKWLVLFCFCSVWGFEEHRSSRWWLSFRRCLLKEWWLGLWKLVWLKDSGGSLVFLFFDWIGEGPWEMFVSDE